VYIRFLPRSYPIEFGRAVASIGRDIAGVSHGPPRVMPPDDMLIANLDEFFMQPIDDHWEDVTT
jgi:hypothetical protein